MPARETHEDTSFINASIPARPMTALISGTTVSGKLSYDCPVKIDSRFSGELKVRDLLVLGPNAEVKADISAEHLQVEGSLVGKVRVSGWIEILPGGRFQGNIEAGSLRVHPGGVFDGKGEISLDYAHLSS
ncbi:MAG: polymer-forming cytoskeletal protein [Candidatus Binatia bacterium]